MTDVRIPLGLSARDVASVVFRHRWAALLCYAVIVVGTAAYCFFWPPSYEATVRYLLKNDRVEPLLSADQEGIRTVSRPSVTEADLNSETEIMLGHGVLERTARERGLEHAPEHWAVRLLRAPVEFGTEVYNAYHRRPAESSLDRAIRRLRDAVTVEPQRESSVILVRLRWGHPRVAEEILTSHSQAYLAQHLALRRGPDSSQFFASQVDRARTELARIDRDIAAIRPGATSAQLEADRGLAAHQATQFEAERRQARARQDEARARIAGVKTQLQPLPDRLLLQDRSIVSAAALETLKLRVLELRLQHTELSQKYNPAQPVVVQVQQRLAEAQQMLADEEQRSYSERTTGRNQIADAFEQNLRESRVQLDELVALERAMMRHERAFRTQVVRLEADAARLRDLERERGIVERSLQDYVRQFEEARVNDEMQFVNVAALEPVTAGAAPVNPAVGLLLKLALGLGLIVSLGLTFALDFIDHRIHTDAELEAATGVPVLAVLDRYPARVEDVHRRA